MSEEHAQLVGQRISDSPYIVQEYLCGGAFGKIYSGYNEVTGERVAIKMERIDAPKAQLHLEFGFYMKLSENKEWKYTPKVYTFGVCLNWNAIVMDILGPSLLNMYKRLGKPFSLRSIAVLGMRFMNIFDWIHNKGLIFRDVKPENFLVGPPNTSRAHRIYMIDLGLCKEWRLENGEHIPFAQGKCITGTLQYMSLNMHYGFELSRRDDLEAVMYMLVYLGRGTLPWLEATKNETLDLITKIERYGELKRSTTPHKLCSSMGDEFLQIFMQIKQLKFEEDPDYDDYLNRFELMLKRTGVKDVAHPSKQFDWDSSHRPRGSSGTSISAGANRINSSGYVNKVGKQRSYSGRASSRDTSHTSQNRRRRQNKSPCP